MPVNPLMNDVPTANIPTSGARPNTAIQEGAASIGEDIGNLVKGNLENKLQKNLDSATAQFLDSAAAQTNARLEPSDDLIASVLNESGGATAIRSAEPAVAQVLRDIGRAKLAREQGTIDVNELKIRHEQILRDAIAAHPHLAPDMIKAAGQTLGYNPLGSAIDALASKAHLSAAAAQKEDPIEKRYDSMAQEMGMDFTDKYSSPVQWYTRVHKYAQIREEQQFRARMFDDATKLRIWNGQQQEDEFAKLAPAMAMDELHYITGQMQALNQDAQGRNEGILSGSLQKRRDAMVTHLAQFQSKVEAAFPLVGGDIKQRAMSGVYDAFKVAINSADPEKALGNVKSLIEAQVFQNTALRFPNYATTQSIVEMLGKLPPGSPLTTAIEREIGDTTTLAMGRMFGAVLQDGNKAINADGTFNPGSDSLIPASVQRNLTPDQVTKATNQVFTNFQSLLGQAQGLTPDSRSRAYKATLGALATYSNDYFRTVDVKGKAPPKSTVDGALTTMSSDAYLSAVRESGFQDVERNVYTAPVRKFIEQRATDTISGIAAGMQQELSGNARLNPKFRYDSTKADQPYMIRNTQQLSALVHLEWANGHAKIVPNDQNNVDVMGWDGDYNDLVRATNGLQMRFGSTLTDIVRANAHNEGSNDYESSLKNLFHMFGDVNVRN